MFKNIVLICIAVIPIIFLLKYTFDKDKIEKEPLLLLLKLFVSGMFSSIIVLIVSLSLEMVIDDGNKFYDSFVKVGLVEEICKWISIYVITWRHKEFNYKFDAIVYCIFVSLGFALVENIGYSFHYGIGTALLRSIISVPGHAFFAIYMGYYLGRAKLSYSKKNIKSGNWFTVYSVLIPTLLHGIYNYCLISQNDGIYIIFIMFIISLYILSFKTINISSKLDIAFDNE